MRVRVCVCVQMGNGVAVAGHDQEIWRASWSRRRGETLACVSARVCV